jgi:hypothetical protein
MSAKDKGRGSSGRRNRSRSRSRSRERDRRSDSRDRRDSRRESSRERFQRGREERRGDRGRDSEPSQRSDTESKRRKEDDDSRSRGRRGSLRRAERERLRSPRRDVSARAALPESRAPVPDAAVEVGPASAAAEVAPGRVPAPVLRLVFVINLNFNAAVASVMGTTVTLYRFVTPARAASYLHQMTPANYARAHAALAAASFGDILSGQLNEHTNGAGGSPFISLALDARSVAASTDSSAGGVQSIVNLASRLERFSVPAAYLLPGFSELAQSETEIVALLPIGVTLDRFRTSSVENPYRNRSRAQVQQLLTGRPLTETRVREDAATRQLSVFQQDRQLVLPAAPAAPAARVLSLATLPPAIVTRIEEAVDFNLAQLSGRRLTADERQREIEKYIVENSAAIEVALQD